MWGLINGFWKKIKYEYWILKVKIFVMCEDISNMICYVIFILLVIEIVYLLNIWFLLWYEVGKVEFNFGLLMKKMGK